ncbi:MAG: divergent polysaccharide deacetylase family protein [Pseudomonadota bacterium]
MRSEVLEQMSEALKRALKRRFTEGLPWPILFVIGVFSGVLMGVLTGAPTHRPQAAPITTSVVQDEPYELAFDQAPHNIEALIPQKTTDQGLAPTPDAVPSLRSPSRLSRPSPVPSRQANPVSPKPKIAIVIDDVGLSWQAFEAVNNLPAPVTVGFLPYGKDAQEMLDALRPGHEAMLHLPMEPRERVQDAGPNMLPLGVDDGALHTILAQNMAKLEGYKGVNNHTGSAFTADEKAMALVLSELKAKNLYFLDSVTTPNPASQTLPLGKYARVVQRDVFIDPDYASLDEDMIKQQLAQLEHIALVEGQAIGIGHPYPLTLNVLGPWLVTAEARGFELVPVSALAPTQRDRLFAALR